MLLVSYVCYECCDHLVAETGEIVINVRKPILEKVGYNIQSYGNFVVTLRTAVQVKTPLRF
jgi:hypothetical protein